VVLTFVVVIAHRSGTLGNLDNEDELRSLLQNAGFWGPTIYIVALSVAEPLGVPGVLFIISAGVVWSTPWAILFSWLGAMCAEFLGFAFARWAAREWVATRLPARFRRYDALVSRHALGGVLVLRLMFFMAAPVTWLLGVSSVGLRPFLLGTALGLIPGIVVFTVAGGNVLEWLVGHPAVALTALTVGVLGAVWRRRRP
jgi:uncharacterized membrane protein YdjX (TVP38/TMEM64 family)